ncbi:hypothetical protein ACIBL6_14625 [Streptomyces sp. NPDC050400]|uniref:hypothetical protein n=1 Tax=Streptomyces sp. NPDC050400 TaxID=3365610 RepID=UPI00378E7B19
MAVLSLTGFALLLVASGGSLFIPLKHSPWPDLMTIGYAILPILAMFKIGAGEYERGQIVMQGIIWGLIVIAVTHTIRLKFTPRVFARASAKRQAQARETQ